SLHIFRAWVLLHAPNDQRLTSDEALQLLRELQPVFTTPPEIPPPYFVRALVHTAAGQWEEARLDLVQCRKLLGKDELPTTVGAYSAWYRQAGAATTVYLDATQEVLAHLPVSPGLRIRLGEEVL